MARSFRCEFRNELCDDPRCKKGYCVPETELNAKYSRGDLDSSLVMEPDLKREAKAIAESILKENGIRATADLISKVIAMPRVRELALEQLRRYNEALRLVELGLKAKEVSR